MSIPTLTLNDVSRYAEQFLRKYHPTNSLPIPIEEIVELKMGISIILVPGIKMLLGIDAFINSDFSKITIDEQSFTKFPQRTRFSIAHEIGHFILHKEWYEKNGPKSVDDYVNFFDRIDDQSYKFTQIQADTFAGMVLAPRTLLARELKARLGTIPTDIEPELLTQSIQDLPDVFQVSDAVILIRLQREGFVKNSPIYCR